MCGFNPISCKEKPIKLTAACREFLDNVWKVYGKYEARYLETLTHSELPWQNAREGLEIGDVSRNIIDIKFAGKYYEERLTPKK